MKVLRFLYDNLKDRKKIFWTVFIVSIINGAFVTAMALSFGRISERNIAQNEQAVMVSMVFFILTLFTSFIIRRYGETLALTTAEAVRSRMIARLVHVPLLTLQKRHSGYVLSLINRVADTLQPVLFNLFWWAAGSVVLFIVTFSLVWQQSLFVFVFDIFIVIAFVVLSQWLSMQILHFNKAVNHAKSSFMSIFADFASNITTVKRLHLTSYMDRTVSQERSKVIWAVNRQQEFHAVRWFMLHGVFGLLFVVTFGLLLWQLNQGLLSVGSFVMLIWLFWGLRGDLNQLAENLKVYTELGGYVAQIEEVLEGDVGQIAPARHKNDEVAVEVKDAIFMYPGSKTKISIPRLTLQKGDILAITGPSGQGKSTILHIIAGLITPQTGSVTLGVSVEDVAIVSQEIELFNTTLRENIALGTSISNARIMTYLEELDLTKIVTSHSEGLDVVIGEKGLRLSTGQKQRVNILRAFVQNRKIILLDEPISHLDPRTATRVVAFMRRHLKGKTCVIISHQPSILELATHVYEMRRHTLTPAPPLHTPSKPLGEV